MDKFVLNVPKWQGELLFTKELLVFVGVFFLMLVGVLFCFWGYKYFRTVLFLGIGTVVCYASFLLVESMTGNLVIRMFLTVSLTFLGICIAYFLDIIWGYFLDRMRLRNALEKNTYLIAAPLGAVIIGLTIYWFIWRDMVVVAVAALICGVSGLIFQHFRRAKTVRFKCYNDLLRIPRSKIDENGLEYIVMETVAKAGLAAVTAQPEPISEPALEAIAADQPEPISEPELEVIAADQPESVPEPISEPELGVMTAVQQESVPEPISEPGLEAMTAVQQESVPEPISEPELEAMTADQQESVPEPISESELGFVTTVASEPGLALESAAVIEAETEPGLIEEIAPERVLRLAAGEMPREGSETIKDMLIERMEAETENDLLEDAPFVRQMGEYVRNRQQIKQIDIGLAAMAASRHAEAVTAQREAADVMNKAADAMNKAADAMNRASAAVPRADVSFGQRQKPHKKQNSRLAKGAAVAVAGIGLFIAGRASKGRD